MGAGLRVGSPSPGPGPVDLPVPVVVAPSEEVPAAPRTPVHVGLEDGRSFRVWCVDAGLACCAVEVAAAREAHALAEGLPPGHGGRGSAGRRERCGPEVDVLVVAGTVTDKLAPVVRRLYDDLPAPKRVMSFGACSTSGGPYWDSYCVTKGVDQLVPVDVWVPGCPPRPEALLQGLRRLGAPGAAHVPQDWP